MQRIEVRSATEADYAKIALLESECFSEPWSEDSIRQTAEGDHAVVLVGCVDGEVVGYGGMLVLYDEAEMLNLAVTSSARKAGVGRAIMNALSAVAKSRGATRLLLEVRVSNASAIRLYEGLGFGVITTRKGYYANGEDALIYELKL
jgi:ribosomal-protein-alanine N-acetyltransferase